ncbi:sphingolipid homeostasis protein orm1 [Mycoemilia scoparia]|uniref:Sphingolipid homeostasis protein orm1 n=1 Tax=Mycoemilia scoparia TaxID=417184 RepID=A0A9W8DV83_9FUNG|nr:sphingolipid homeostasis protein orm1 [Mycoemilia scoparia]
MSFIQRVSSSKSLDSLVNKNSSWVNLRGSWLTHIIGIVGLKLFFGVIPGLSLETGWTLTNLGYCLIQYLIFHAFVGSPFDEDQGENSSLTLWEQIDDGEHFTPSKKFLTTLPIALFLVATHYSNYNAFEFMINFLAVLVISLAKLPAMHRRRFFGINLRE